MSVSAPQPPPWRPTRLVRVIQSYDTSMGTTKIKSDATFAFIKTLGNRQGPHALASEFVASSLAKWFGLIVPDFAIMDLPSEACFALPRNCRSEPGPAFVSRFVPGETWSGSSIELQSLQNPSDITRLVVFDTWVRNCDRHPPDLTTRKPNYANVYLARTERPGASRLVAIDHTHCFDGGRDFSERLSHIDKVRDEAVFGLFPAFAPLIDSGELHWCSSMLRSLTRDQIEAIAGRIPPQWEVTAATSSALVDQILGRAAFVADMIVSGWPPRTAAGNRSSATAGE